MIYQPLVATGYEWINACDKRDYESFFSFNGSLLGDVWSPVKVRRVRADDSQKFNPSDFPWLGSHALVMRQKAVDALKDIWCADGEILPLATEDDVPLYVFNAPVVDALDEANSEIIRFPGSHRIMRVKKIAFLTDVIKEKDVFRLSHRASSTFVSEKFVKRFNEENLVGLEFREVF